VPTKVKFKFFILILFKIESKNRKAMWFEYNHKVVQYKLLRVLARGIKILPKQTRRKSAK
jgi:hypothetical protein